MAGVTLAGLERITGHGRVIRAMSSPAAARGLAFSPYIAGPEATPADAALAHALLAACGPAEPVPDENQIDLFTALTGPVPGFVAAFAAMLADWAAARGVDPGLADRAVRQLVRAAGEVMATTAPTPAERVAEMVDYAGTTAAGLSHLATTTMAADLARALDASVDKARAIAAGPDA
ncbi:MAG: pyrroline-5-carboxylate reductase dimerization domain-containing protein [Paracoccaceae bacterium]